jgi:hypothetical protein
MDEVVSRRWEGWTVLDDGDAFEFQLEECQGHLEVLERDRSDLVADIVARLEWVSSLDRSATHELEAIHTFLEHVDPGTSVTVSPWVAEHVAVPVDDGTRRRVLCQVRETDS